MQYSSSLPYLQDLVAEVRLARQKQQESGGDVPDELDELIRGGVARINNSVRKNTGSAQVSGWNPSIRRKLRSVVSRV